MKKYKFLRSELKSYSGNLTWEIGKWEKTKGKLNICNNGLHCSKYPDQAFSYVQGEILAIVETRGKSIIQDDKECWEEMRIVKAYNWKKEDSVAMAIYAAELVIDIYEKKYPNDDRPRKAIEAAKTWLKDPSDENAEAARAAAWAVAEAARAAAWAVAGAAWAVARDVAGAAWAAAWAARAAAWAAAGDAARAAAWAAGDAGDAITKKIRTWMTKRIKELEEIK